ncbi:hypothetical protein V5799_008839 [Amblyomma americanum]|uniref:Uncharacterized protein n=1 Tax=Amblyomma americanum TaxID=6943 RepID=A0AAQ4FBW5_AMBAM
MPAAGSTADSNPNPARTFSRRQPSVPKTNGATFTQRAQEKPAMVFLRGHAILYQACSDDNKHQFISWLSGKPGFQRTERNHEDVLQNPSIRRKPLRKVAVLDLSCYRRLRR